MTDTKKAPPTSQAAKRKGNFLFDKAVREEADRRGLGGGTLGLGQVRLVKGETKPGMVVFGALAGIPVQQTASQVVLQQLMGASPTVADGVTAGAGVAVHLLARTSFTLGLAFSMLAPFVAQGTQKAVSWIAGVFRPALPATGTAPAGGALGNRQRTQAPQSSMVTKLRTSAA